MQWDIISASAIGSSHLKHEIVCQDYSSTHFDDDCLILVVADGAGSCLNSDIGARFVCEEATQLTLNHVSEFKTSDDLETSFLALVYNPLTWKLKDFAEENNYELKSLSSTFLFVMVIQNRAILAQMGDGSIHLKFCADYIGKVFQDQSEYVNETFFITSDIKNLQIRCLSDASDIDAIVLGTDGIDPIALKVDTLHRRFIDPILTQMSVVDKNLLQFQLGNFLKSERVNEKTDDDKTLVIAKRCHEKLSD